MRNSQANIAIIGAGPAGLMAAEVIAQGGAVVTVYDAMPSAGRKFLMAGRGGLNLTPSESLPTFLELLGPREIRERSALPILLGLVLAVTSLVAAGTALGLVFDPRYQDFPFAALTMAVAPFATLMLLNRPKAGARPIAEAVFAGLLAGAAVFIGFNEGPDNWQSLWTCAAYLLFALTLWQARGVQIPELAARSPGPTG